MVGQQYEPYIFAALNSAKVMIVVGTQEKYLNATWVKNEWSRFLIMMKKDRTKVILPCYRDMDPYKMPEQLKVLQSYDMSKIGFAQDLIRGVAKILKIDKPEHQEKNYSDIKYVSDVSADVLLERGFMALEDKEWDKADEFFEKALNQDAKNAKAYYGKALAHTKAVNLAEFVQKRWRIDMNPVIQKVVNSGNNLFIEQMLTEYTIPFFLEKEEIAKIINVNKENLCMVKIYEERYELEKQYWKMDKNLKHAMEFATGELSENLKKAHDEILLPLNDAIKNAEEYQRIACENVKLEIENLYENASARRKEFYRESCELIKRPELDFCIEAEKVLEKENQYIQLVNKVKNNFIVLGNYLDSKQLVKQCETLIEESEEIIKSAKKEIKDGELEERDREQRYLEFQSGLKFMGIAVLVLIVLSMINC